MQEENEASQPSLPGYVNVNERQFLESVREKSKRRFNTDSMDRYLREHASAALPDDDDVFESDHSVLFSEIARPQEHKRAIAVNAFVGWTHRAGEGQS